MSQQEQDELFDFYSMYGQHDQDGKPLGLFQRAQQAHDDADLDLTWEDFVAGNLTPAVAAHEEARAARAAKDAEPTVPMDALMDLPPIE